MDSVENNYIISSAIRKKPKLPRPGDNANKINCNICGENFEEPWIKCDFCAEWSHEACANIEGHPLYYKCETTYKT